MSTQPKIEPDMRSLEQALAPVKSFAPPTERGIRELVSEVIQKNDDLHRLLKIIDERLAHFDRMSANFYNGRGE
jgi:hypothetical protein